MSPFVKSGLMFFETEMNFHVFLSESLVPIFLWNLLMMKNVRCQIFRDSDSPKICSMDIRNATLNHWRLFHAYVGVRRKNAATLRVYSRRQTDTGRRGF